MRSQVRKLVLVHGLWDKPNVFDRLVSYLSIDDLIIFTPHLPHDGGRIGLKNLAIELDRLILERYGHDQFIELLGFSMGGIICRIWLQQMGGAHRTDSFISIGSPHYGTYTAQVIPHWLFCGVADMKRGSQLIQELNNNIQLLHTVRCSSYFCRWDLMTFPGWQAVLPIGDHFDIPVLTHKDLIANPRSLRILAKTINFSQLRDQNDVLRP